MNCPTCQNPVRDEDALFCAQCGAPLHPPMTVELPFPGDTPAEAVTPPALPPLFPPPPAPLEPPAAIDNRRASFIAFAAAALVIMGAFQEWIRIRISGFIPPGSAETGWNGGDGRTIVVAGAVAAVAAVGLLLGRRDLWLKVALLIAGGVTFVISVVNMVDANSKAHDIEVRFGIPAGDVRAQLGVGLYFVAIGGIGLLAAGLRARTTS